MKVISDHLLDANFKMLALFVEKIIALAIDVLTVYGLVWKCIKKMLSNEFIIRLLCLPTLGAAVAQANHQRALQ